MKYLPSKLITLLLILVVGMIASSTAFGTATIVIQNNDAPGVGFNDPTAANPVGGNSGTTVGQQRLNAFQFAADVWGATLISGPIITIRASWAAQTCTANSGTLGSAGAATIHRNFTGAAFPNTWYSVALANALAGSDLNTTFEINAQFNVNLGTPGCLENAQWYYGLDNNHGVNGIDLVTVLLHEFAHGLGFQTFTNSSTGAQSAGFPSIYDKFLFDNTAGMTWEQMTTNAERQASAINTGKLAWIGPQVTSDAPGVLSGTPRLRVNSPPSIAGNYQIGTADFGPPLSSPGVTANVVQGAPNDGCSALTNVGAVSGKIALIDRGNCTFVIKVKNAQNAGAVGVIIADNVVFSTPPGMLGSDPTITIPSVSITMADGNTIKAQLPSGVNATLFIDVSATAGVDQFGRPLLFTPNPVQGGSSVSHWDTTATPNQLMEPNISGSLSHSVTTPQDLTFSLLRDIGWCAGCPQPPPPPPPTPTPPAAANDNFVNAQTISGCAGSVTGHNFAATHEAGEPPSHSPDGDPGGGSVWYQWQAPSSGSVTMTTAGSDYDTLLAVYTGTSVNGLTLIVNNDDVDPGNVTTSTVTFNATAGTLYKIAVDGWDNARGNIVLNWSESGCVSPNTIRFSATNYPIGEGQGSVVISVVRIDPTGTATVDLRTADTDTFVNGCAEKVKNNGSAYGRCDFATTVTTVTIPAGQLSTNVLVPIIDDSWAEGTETFTVQLSNPTGPSLGMPSTSTVTIIDNETVDGPNPIFTTPFFVRLHYLDFLSREPEAGEPWSDVLNNCTPPGNTTCDRVGVSGAFFGSPEFKLKGFFVYRFYKLAFNRLPLYSEITPDMSSVTGQTPAEVFQKKGAFTNAFVLRPEFNAYNSMSNAQYVAALMNRYSLTQITTPDPAAPDGTTTVMLTTADLTNQLNAGTLTRAQVLRAIADSDQVSSAEFNRGFVAMQYYGYLRRTPEEPGYTNWLNYLNANPADSRTMVNGFVNSIEYRLRFGP